MLNYSIVEGADQMDLAQVMALLKETYWAADRSAQQVEKSMEHSRCYGIYLQEAKQLVGFARVISDFATTYYLCDVVIASRYRGNGLGKALVAHIEQQPEYQGLRGILITRDAHSLYEKFGYQTIDGRAMVKGLNC